MLSTKASHSCGLAAYLLRAALCKTHMSYTLSVSACYTFIPCMHAGLDLVGKAQQEHLAGFVAWLEDFDLAASREERTFSVWLSSLLDAPLRCAHQLCRDSVHAVQLACNCEVRQATLPGWRTLIWLHRAKSAPSACGCLPCSTPPSGVLSSYRTLAWALRRSPAVAGKIRGLAQGL